MKADTLVKLQDIPANAEADSVYYADATVSADSVATKATLNAYNAYRNSNYYKVKTDAALVKLNLAEVASVNAANAKDKVIDISDKFVAIKLYAEATTNDIIHFTTGATNAYATAVKAKEQAELAANSAEKTKSAIVAAKAVTDAKNAEKALNECLYKVLSYSKVARAKEVLDSDMAEFYYYYKLSIKNSDAIVDLSEYQITVDKAKVVYEREKYTLLEKEGGEIEWSAEFKNKEVEDANLDEELIPPTYKSKNSPADEVFLEKFDIGELKGKRMDRAKECVLALTAASAIKAATYNGWAADAAKAKAAAFSKKNNSEAHLALYYAEAARKKRLDSEARSANRFTYHATNPSYAADGNAKRVGVLPFARKIPLLNSTTDRFPTSRIKKPYTTTNFDKDPRYRYATIETPINYLRENAIIYYANTGNAEEDAANAYADAYEAAARAANAKANACAAAADAANAKANVFLMVSLNTNPDDALVKVKEAADAATHHASEAKAASDDATEAANRAKSNTAIAKRHVNKVWRTATSDVVAAVTDAFTKAKRHEKTTRKEINNVVATNITHDDALSARIILLNRADAAKRMLRHRFQEIEYTKVCTDSINKIISRQIGVIFNDYFIVSDLYGKGVRYFAKDLTFLSKKSAQLSRTSVRGLVGEVIVFNAKLEKKLFLAKKPKFFVESGVTTDSIDEVFFPSTSILIKDISEEKYN